MAISENAEIHQPAVNKSYLLSASDRNPKFNEDPLS